MKEKIRIGLLIDTYIVPFWAYKMIEDINSCSFAEIVLVVKKEQNNPPKSFIRLLFEKHNFVLHFLYCKLESFIFRKLPDAFEKKDLKQLLFNTTLIAVKCIEKKFSDYLIEDDIKKIEKQNIDLFVRLGFKILRGDILKIAKLGIWSYHHGDNLVNRGGPPAFWEVFEKWRETGAVLQILTEDLDGGAVMYRSWATVSNTLNETINNNCWKSSLFLQRKLKELYDLGEEKFLEKSKTTKQYT